MASAPSPHGDRRAGLAVGGAVLLGMLAAAPPFFIRSSDGSAMLATAESLVQRGDLAIDDRYLGDVPLKPSARRGPDGRAYAKYGIGWPLVLAGVLAAATAVGVTPGSPAMTWVLVTVNPLVSALTAVLALAMARELGAGRRWALALAIGGSLTTFAWTSGTFDHADPLLTVLMTGAFWCTLRFARTQARRDAAVAGLLLGAAILTKSSLVVMAPGIVAGLVVSAWHARRRHVPPRTGTRGATPSVATVIAPLWPLLACAPGVLGGIGAQFWLNEVRWGSPWTSGYNEPVLTGDLGIGLWQLTVGLNRGVLWHAPVAVAGLAAVAAGWRRHPAWSVAVVLGFGSLLVLSARFYEYGGGWAWGPRYLLPAVPALAASAAWATRSRGGRWLTGAALGLGLAFTLPGVLVDPSAARTTFETAYLPEAAGTVRAGDVLRPGVVVEHPRSVDEILPEFSGIAVSLWLLRVLAEPCACDRSTWWCACADGRDMYWNERFRDPPWRARYPAVEARPPYGQDILAPALLGAWYRRAVFDVTAAAPPAGGPRGEPPRSGRP